MGTLMFEVMMMMMNHSGAGSRLGLRVRMEK